MGVFAARFRFVGEPPTREAISERLHAELGHMGKLTGSRREGQIVMILVAFDAFTPAYASKVMRELGGVPVHHETDEPLYEPLPPFVDKPWFQHDEPTRQAIIRDFEERTR